MHCLTLLNVACSLSLLAHHTLGRVAITLQVDSQDVLAASSHAGNTKAHSLAIDKSPDPVFSTLKNDFIPTNCGKEGDVFQFTSLTADPNLIPRSKANVTFTLTGTLNAVLAEQAYLRTYTSPSGVIFDSKRYDICNELRALGGDVQCPIPKGNVTIKYNQYWEDLSPGWYRTQMTGYTAAGENVICLKVEAFISPDLMELSEL